MRIRRILCPVDFSEFSVKAYDYAHSVADRYRAELYVLYVQRPEDVPYQPCVCWAPSRVLCDYRKTFLQKADDGLREFIEIHTQNGVRPERVVEEGIPAEHILSLTREQGIDLLVMGTHGRRGLDRLMLGSVTEQVLRNAPCPVLVVRRPSHDFVAPDHVGNGVLLHRVLCCIDFSSLTERILGHALSICDEYHAEVSVLHVVEHSDNGSAGEHHAAEAFERLEQLRYAHRRWRSMIKAIVRTGPAYQQIIQVAQDTYADLSIMGIRGRSALSVAMFGSNTYRVIQLGPCPVLIVHA